MAAPRYAIAFLGLNRHELFSDELQLELAEIFNDSTLGKCPVPRAQLALALILQIREDDEVIEVLVMAPFRKNRLRAIGTL